MGSPAQGGSRAGVGDLLARHNPFYLISAACMLTACMLLTNTTTWSPIALKRLLVLLTTVNVYEVALLGLAVILVRRGILRDAGMLLVLHAVFLVDVTFLNAELVSTSYSVGLGVNAGLFVLALGKLWVVRQALGLEVTWAQALQCVVQVTGLFALPMVMQSLARSPLQFYVLWWMIGLLPVLYEVLAKAAGRVGPVVRKSPVPVSMYLALPWLSLVLHLGIFHYVYNVVWVSPMLASLMLGLALVARRGVPSSVASTGQIRFFYIALPAAAVLVSQGNQPYLSIVLAGCRIGPLMLSTAAAYLFYVYVFFARYALWFLGAGAALAAWSFVGPSTEQMGRALGSAAAWVAEQAKRLVPSTTAAWGFVGLVAAFVFLGIGAFVSLRRVPSEKDPMERKIPEKIEVAAGSDANGAETK